MRNILKINLIILLFGVSCNPVYSQLKMAMNYNYLVYLPKNYPESTKPFPLVIYLHGGGQRGNDLNKLKEYGLPYLVSKGYDFEFIVASPQCPGHKTWTTDNWIDSLLIDLNTKYRIDADRIYLTGISMGAYGVYTAAMDRPECFAALLPLCGGCNDCDTAKICNLKPTPIWAFHGTADDKIPISETERIVEKLNHCGGTIRFTRLDGEGHAIQYIYEAKPEIYDWLLKQKK